MREDIGIAFLAQSEREIKERGNHRSHNKSQNQSHYKPAKVGHNSCGNRPCNDKKKEKPPPAHSETRHHGTRKLSAPHRETPGLHFSVLNPGGF